MEDDRAARRSVDTETSDGGARQARLTGGPALVVTRVGTLQVYIHAQTHRPIDRRSTAARGSAAPSLFRVKGHTVFFARHFSVNIFFTVDHSRYLYIDL